MKTKFVMLAAAIAMSHTTAALAQTSSSTIATPDAATTANTSTATTSAANTFKPVIKYLGIFQGPGLKFEGAQQSAGFGDGDAFTIDNRPKFLVRINDNLDAGIEPRFFTNFNSKDWNVTNGNFRVLANIKNVAKNDLIALTLIPRLVLPTSNNAHNQRATVSPELIASLDVAPKNSRFTFNTGIQLIKHLYTDTPGASDYAKSRSFTFDPWAEIDYQLSPNVQLMASYWPDWATSRASNSLANKFQELDVGAYVEVAKGWLLNPYIATNFNGFEASNALNNMQLNIALSGTIL